MDFYKKVAIFEVRCSGSPTNALSVLIKLGISIDIWPSCIATIAACWHKSSFSGFFFQVLDAGYPTISDLDL